MSLRTAPLALILAAVLAPVTAAQYEAAGKVTWNFDEFTTGAAVSWTSPTSVDPVASEYNASWNLELVEVSWSFLFLTGVLDVTDQIPPEQATGSGATAGPAPITLVADSLIYPAPPEPASITADVNIGLNAAGFGAFTASNISLGTVSVDTGILGVVDVTITAIRVKGSLTMHATWFNLAAGLAGTNGEPVFSATGSLEPGSAGQVDLANALPNTSAFVVLSTSLLAAPFKGGHLIPFPDLYFALPTDAAGALSVPFTWPADIPARVPIYMQCWIPDAGGPQGFAASNAIAALTP